MAADALVSKAEPLAGLVRGDDVVHFVADVMDAAVRIALQELGDGRIRAERLEQLDLGVGQRDEHRGHAVGRLRHGGGYLRPERVAIDFAGLGDVAHRDGHMIEPSDHVFLACFSCGLAAAHSIAGLEDGR